MVNRHQKSLDNLCNDKFATFFCKRLKQTTLVYIFALFFLLSYKVFSDFCVWARVYECLHFHCG